MKGSPLMAHSQLQLHFPPPPAPRPAPQPQAQAPAKGLGLTRPAAQAGTSPRQQSGKPQPQPTGPQEYGLTASPSTLDRALAHAAAAGCSVGEVALASGLTGNRPADTAQRSAPDSPQHPTCPTVSTPPTVGPP